MPGSVAFGKPQVLDFLLDNHEDIKRCLDIGVGSGTYSHLLKQSNNNCEIIGIEIFEPYVEKYNLLEHYSDIIIADVRTYDLQSLGNFDVIFAGDVLEHMYRDEADEVIKKLLSMTKCLIISLPIIEINQGEIDGNIYEEHLTPDWTHEQFVEKYKLYIIKQVIPENPSPDEPVGVYWLSMQHADYK